MPRPNPSARFSSKTAPRERTGFRFAQAGLKPCPTISCRAFGARSLGSAGEFRESEKNRHKVPHPYSPAEESAGSLTGFGMTLLILFSRELPGAACLQIAFSGFVFVVASLETALSAIFPGGDVVLLLQRAPTPSRENRACWGPRARRAWTARALVLQPLSLRSKPL